MCRGFSSCLRPAEVFMSLPMAAWPEAIASMHAAEPPTVGTLLRELGLASSNREVREFLGGGAVRLNGEVVKEDRPIGGEDVLDGGYTLVRRGRKNWAAVRWS